jgi:hypothetical protein
MSPRVTLRLASRPSSPYGVVVGTGRWKARSCVAARSFGLDRERLSNQTVADSTPRGSLEPTLLAFLGKRG